ncbi:TPA: hypothetical protein ACGO9X_000451, partial [Streptococcus suis]
MIVQTRSEQNSRERHQPLLLFQKPQKTSNNNQYKYYKILQTFALQKQIMAERLGAKKLLLSSVYSTVSPLKGVQK